MDHDFLLHSYFSKNLTKDQEHYLNELLKTDKAFKEQFDFELDVQRVSELREHRNLKSKLIGFENDISKKEKQGFFAGDFRKWTIAASILLLFSLSWLSYNSFLSLDYNELYEENYVEYPSTVHAILRGENNNKSLEQKAFEAYDTNDNAQAILLFKELKSTKNPEYADFYLAQTYLKIGEIEKAKKIFEDLISSKNELSPEAQWYLALIYIKNGEKEKGINTLNEIIAEGKYNKTEAQKLLKKLD